MMNPYRAWRRYRLHRKTPARRLARINAAPAPCPAGPYKDFLVTCSACTRPPQQAPQDPPHPYDAAAHAASARDLYRRRRTTAASEPPWTTQFPPYNPATTRVDPPADTPRVVCARVGHEPHPNPHGSAGWVCDRCGAPLWLPPTREGVLADLRAAVSTGATARRILTLARALEWHLNNPTAHEEDHR